MMADNPSSFQTSRPSIFNVPPPLEHLTDLYGHLAHKHPLYIVVTNVDGIDKVLIVETKTKNIKHCYVFWRKRDAYSYATYSGLTATETQVWSTSLKDLINFITRTNNKDVTTQIIACAFKKGLLIDVDTLWPAKEVL